MAAGPPAIHMVSLGCGSQTGIGSLAIVPTDPISGIVTGPIGAVNLRCGTPDPAPDPAPVHVAWSNDNSAALVDAQGRLWTWGYNYDQVLNRSLLQPHGPQGELPLPPGCEARTACDKISGSGTPGIADHDVRWPNIFGNRKVKQVFGYEEYESDWSNFMPLLNFEWVFCGADRVKGGPRGMRPGAAHP
jgi:hypothetical protein